MRQRWETLAFLHWDYPVAPVQRLLPGRLRVEPWEGRAWVSLVAFHMRVRPPVGPAVAGLTTFPETNLRTYVVGPDGKAGIWFFSLDAANAPAVAVAVARLGLGLPYFLAAMEIEREDGQVRYRSQRRNRRTKAGHDIEVRPGDPLPDGALGEFDHYLTARFRLWSAHLGRVISVPAEHPPWALRRMTLVRADQTITDAAGLPRPTRDPVLHYANGVDVAIGPPELG